MARTTSSVSDDPQTKRPDPNRVARQKKAEKAAAQKERQARLSSSDNR